MMLGGSIGLGSMSVSRTTLEAGKKKQWVCLTGCAILRVHVEWAAMRGWRFCGMGDVEMRDESRRWDEFNVRW